MKNSTKMLAALVPVATLAFVAPAVSDVEAAGDYQLSEVVYDNGSGGGIVDYTDLSSAMLDGQGEVYDFVNNRGIKALGIADGVYISYEGYASGVLDNKSVDEIMAELGENPLPEEDISGYEPVVFGEIPEVIDIY
ncbi:hypothetical protein [Salimicrobium flavidum]|uniref:Uncharacterized protein n=1 Tax=Salimicrobium flavidum TaxID=570947 RepID=A0A1N7IWI6_9BACI|nr:hypothetical protein [Salimicrobium flavidum]SIS41445.1 hypothetical protein SAMN05421687_102363 [Salimicrobium flavidum]